MSAKPSDSPSTRAYPFPRKAQGMAEASSIPSKLAINAATTGSWSERRKEMSTSAHAGSPPSTATASSSSAVHAADPPRRKAPPAYVPSENMTSVGIPAAMSEGIQKAMHELEKHGDSGGRRGCTSCVHLTSSLLTHLHASL